MIKVYQIRLTDAQVDAINRGEESELSKAYFSRSFDRHFDPQNFQFYTHVANVDTNDMEEAFELMNLWEKEYMIERLGRCSSMSVGDILEMEDGTRYRCASFGFERI
jgi:hypothetical protein